MIDKEHPQVSDAEEKRYDGLVDSGLFSPSEARAIITGVNPSQPGVRGQAPYQESKNLGQAYTPADGVSGRDMGLQEQERQGQVATPLSDETIDLVRKQSLALQRSRVARALIAGQDPTAVRVREIARKARRQRTLPPGSLFRD